MSSDFHHGVVKALDDNAVRGHLRKAMDSLIEKRRALFPDKDELALLRERCMQIRANALSKLPELLEQLESRCEAQEIQLHWAETTEQANKIVLQILESHQVKSLVKSKSMVSEEMGLNHFLEDAGIECLESDLGEFIIQLAGETPSHIVMHAAFAASVNEYKTPPRDTMKNLEDSFKEPDKIIADFIKSLDLPQSVKDELLNITPENYTGICSL